MKNIISKCEKNEQFSKDYDKFLLKKHYRVWFRNYLLQNLGILGIIKTYTNV